MCVFFFCFLFVCSFASNGHHGWFKKKEKERKEKKTSIKRKENKENKFNIIYGKGQKIKAKLKNQIWERTGVRSQDSLGIQGENIRGSLIWITWGKAASIDMLLFLLKIHISRRKNQIFQSWVICTSVTKEVLGILLTFPTKTLSKWRRETILQGRTELLTLED